MASPGFASPSTRLMQRDYGSSRDSEHLKHSLESAVGTLGAGVGVGGGGGGVSGLEASTMGLLSTSGNEVLHYTFRPSKQIVSISVGNCLGSMVLTLAVYALMLSLHSFCFSHTCTHRAMLLSIRKALLRAALRWGP